MVNIQCFLTPHSANTLDLLRFPETMPDVHFSLSRYFILPQEDACLRKGISVAFEAFKIFDMI